MKLKNLPFVISLFVSAVSFAQTEYQTNLWGVTAHGGVNNNGALIKMNMDGSGFTKVYDFVDSIGSTPVGNLVQTNDGKLYGNCETGGESGSCVIYSFDPATNTYSDLFDYGANTGDDPTSGLILGKDGMLYGAAFGGGLGGTSGGGVIFSFNPATNEYTDLYDMDLTTGYSPLGQIMQAADGKLYGLDYMGGANEAGVIFSFDISTKTYSDLYDFPGGNVNAPLGGLIQLSNGMLYGMTSGGYDQFDTLGNPTAGTGNIFSFDPSNNSYTDLYEFNGTEGGGPMGSLMYANGKLFGMTENGGANNAGVIFSYDISLKAYTDLFDFDFDHGANPYGDLMQSSDNNLYGSTSGGGLNGLGVIFRFNPVTKAITNLVDFDGNNGATPSGGGFVEAYTSATKTAVIDPAGAGNQLSVFPVPASQLITVNINSANATSTTLTLQDINGQTLLTEPVTAVNGTFSKSIDIRNLSAGVYFINATVNNEKRVSKIVKE